MCGRFTLKTNNKKLAEAFSGVISEEPVAVEPRYNIAPSQPIAVIANNGHQKIEYFQWGLVPSWAKDPSIGNRMINARAETLAEKSSFKTAYRRRRCLVLADGFYEWRKNADKTKTPLYIGLASEEPFAFAGLWEWWQGGEGSEILSCTIITTTPNSLMANIHDRMPVILPAKAYAQWLDPAEQKPEQLEPLLKPYPAELMQAYSVSTLVNNPRNDLPDCVASIADPA
jgi:putative SOS response-associated peptidase YedK